MYKSNKQDWAQIIVRKNKRISQLESEVKNLKEDLIEAYKEIFDNLVSPSSMPGLEGWLATNATTSAVNAGDKLVEFGIMEKHPTAGKGRVQFYRPIPRAGKD